MNFFFVYSDAGLLSLILQNCEQQIFFLKKRSANQSVPLIILGRASVIQLFPGILATVTRFNVLIGFKTHVPLEMFSRFFL